MKKFIITFIAIAFLSAKAFAYDYDFSYTYQGQTLYYTIVNGNAEVTYQNTSSPRYTNLTGTLTIPSSVTYNGTTYAVTSIGSYAFQNCSGLTSLTIGNSVTSIGSYAFQSCSGLTSVTIGNSVTSIGSYAFQGCSGLTIVNFNATNCTNMGSYNYPVFSGCTNLATLNIGANVTQIPNYAFKDYSGLTSVTIPNSVTSIGWSAFKNCSGLTTVNFNATNCTTMGSSNSPVFDGCTHLATLNIGNNVTQIPDYAFKNYSGLTSVTIPNSVTRIGSYAFQSCSGLTSVNYTGTIAQWCGIYFIGSTSNPIYYSHTLSIGGSPLTNLVIPEGVTEIKQVVFQGCSGLTSVTIPSSVTSIGEYAFQGCSGLTIVNFNATNCTNMGSYDCPVFSGCTNLATLIIGANVNQIPHYAFKNFSGLTSVTVGNSVDSIGVNAFYNCSNLTTVNFNADSCNYSGYESGNSLYLPFGSTCTALTTVNIGSNVKALPDYIFAYCTNLTNINLPDSLKYIGKYALSNTAISGSITIPNSVTRINHAAFWRCYNITNITLPNTLSDIGTAAFMNDTSLVSINLPISLTHIRKNLFRRCYHLSSVDLSHVTKIDSTAFQACETFNTLTIPSCVTEIAYAAFATCTGITEITFEGRTPPIIGDSAFINIPSTVPVYIPCGTLALYAARLPYMNNFVEETFTFSAVSEDENKGSVQVLNEPTCTNPNAVLNAVPTNGYRFDHWSTGSTSNPYSLTVTTDTIITAYFVSEGPQMFTISTAVNDPLMGSVTGGGEYAEGSTVTLTAVPNSGYTFALWLDGNTNNPRTITVTEDATYTAVFQESNGIIDVDGNNIHIYVEGGNIRINGIENEKVQVFDMVGRPVGTQSLPTGVYMVRVGTFPARRVVVIR